MAIPILDGAVVSLTSDLNTEVQRYNSPPYQLYGSSNWRGLYLHVESRNPSFQGFLLGYAQYRLSLAGQIASCVIEQQEVISGYSNIYYPPQFNRAITARIAFIAVPYLGLYDVSTGPII